MTESEKERRSARRHLHVMDLVLLIEAVSITAFTLAVLWIFRTTGMEPTALIYSFFGVMGVESGIMGWIKNVKEKVQTDTPDPSQEEGTGALDALVPEEDRK